MFTSIRDPVAPATLHVFDIFISGQIGGAAGTRPCDIMLR